MKKIWRAATTLFWIIIVCAFILAVLPQFDWDIFAFFFWCVDKIWTTIVTLAEKISSMDMFRQIFKR